MNSRFLSTGHLSRAVAVSALVALIVTLAGCVDTNTPAPAASTSSAQTTSLTEEWVDQFGSSEDDVANAVAATDGSVYVVGYTGASLPGQSAAGTWDAFVRKLDADGAVVWTRQFGTAELDVAMDVAVADGAVYVVGYTSVPVQDPNIGSSQDAFIRKYDADGNLLWHDEFGQLYGGGPRTMADTAEAVAVVDGGVIVGGSGSVRVGRYTEYYAFLRRYDAQGGLVWEQFPDYPLGRILDVITTSDAVFVAGDNPIPVGALLAGWRAVLAKYELDGTEDFVHTVDYDPSTAGRPAGPDTIFSLAALDNAIYAVGRDQQRGPNDENLGRVNYLMRFDEQGNRVWARSTPTPVTAASILDGAILAAGDTGPTPLPMPAPSVGDGSDIFIHQYTPQGDLDFSQSFGTSDADELGGMTTRDGLVYLAGATVGTFDGQQFLGAVDAFVAKLRKTGEQPPPSGECATIEGDVVIHSQADLARLSGIDGCFDITGGLFVQQTSDIQDLSFLGGLRSVGGYIGISDNQILGSLAGLEALQSAGAGLVIEGNPSLHTAVSATSLATIGGPLHVFGNPALIQMSFPALTRVQQPQDASLAALVVAANDALVSADLSALQTIDGDAIVENNDGLTTLSMDSLSSVTATLRIAYNTSLPTCAAEAIVNAIGAANIGGGAVIEGNDDSGTCP